MNTALAEVVEPDNVQAIEARVQSETSRLLDLSHMMVVRTVEQADKAAALVRDVATRRREIEEWFREPIEHAHKAHKALTERRKAAVERLAEPERIIKGKLGEYLAEQERILREREAAARREQATQAEAARLAAIEAAGDDPAAQAQAAMIEPPIPPSLPIPEPVKLAGVSSSEKWRAEVVDVQALCRAIADGSQPATLIEPNMTALNGMARALKAALTVPGVRAVADRVVSAR